MQVFSCAHCEFFKNIYFTLEIYLFSGVSLQLKRKSMIFKVKKMFIEIRASKPMTYVFKGHAKIVKKYLKKSFLKRTLWPLFMDGVQLLQGYQG